MRWFVGKDNNIMIVVGVKARHNDPFKEIMSIYEKLVDKISSSSGELIAHQSLH